MKIACSLENRSCALGKALTCDATAVESISGVRCNKFLSYPCQQFGYALLEIQPSASDKVKGAHQCGWQLVLLFAQLRVAKLSRGGPLFFWTMSVALLFHFGTASPSLSVEQIAA